MTTAKRDAFIKGINSGKFETDKSKIYNILKEKTCTLIMLKALGFPEKTSSARISDLMDLGLVEAKGTDRSFFVVVENKEKQDLLIKQRSNLAFNNWLNKGRSNGWLVGDKIANYK